VSVRTRLAGILASVMLLPVLVAGAIAGLFAPHQQNQAARDVVTQAVTSLASIETEICRGLGDGATALALDARGGGVKAAVDAAVTRRADSFALVTRGSTVLAQAGQVPTDPNGNPISPAQLSALSCAHGRVLPGSLPVLGESVEVPLGTGASAATTTKAVVGLVLDANQLAALRDRIGLQNTVQLAVSCPSGGSDTTMKGDNRSRLLQAAATGSQKRIGPYVVAVASPVPSGQPCAFSAATALSGLANVQNGLLLLVLVAVVIGIALVVWLARTITGPVLALTDAAERVAGGDLAIRLPVVGRDELGRLSGSFNRMTAELESQLNALARSRDLLRENVHRLGDALQRTHDLDGLLTTVLAAAVDATSSTRATAWLVEGGSVVARVPYPMTTTRGSVPRLPIGTALAGEVAEDRHPRRAPVGHEDASTSLGGAAMAAPLKRGTSTVGVLLVERDEGAPEYDDEDEETLVSLAGPAGIAVDNVLLHREAQRLSVTDPLTGAGNLRHMTTTLAREVERATRFERPLALLLLDLDHFKRVNDTYGHTVGDAVLRELARRLHEAVREVDTVARYGGEEFVVICPETDAEGAASLADRVCETVRDSDFIVGDDSVAVTVSVGVASLPINGTASGDLVRSADEALYAAKHAGRDQWRTASDLPAAR
jgi:two-component system, cell cycle response regulator